MAGEVDRFPSLEAVGDWVTAIPAARLVVLPHVGHYPHAEAPDSSSMHRLTPRHRVTIANGVPDRGADGAGRAPIARYGPRLPASSPIQNAGTRDGRSGRGGPSSIGTLGTAEELGQGRDSRSQAKALIPPPGNSVATMRAHEIDNLISAAGSRHGAPRRYD